MDIAVLFAGMPGSGKDTAADYLAQQGYRKITYSQDILQPALEELDELRYLLDHSPISYKKGDWHRLCNEMEQLSSGYEGRELYINCAHVLNQFCSSQSEGTYEHFCVLGKYIYDSALAITIAGYRQPEELQALDYLYPRASVVSAFIDVREDLRHARLMERDGTAFEQLRAEDAAEREATIDKLCAAEQFSYIIDNNGTHEQLNQQLKECFGLSVEY